MRFRIVPRKKDREVDTFGDRTYTVKEAEIGTTPERLMAAITNAMGEVVNSPEEFNELCALLIYKSSDWVKMTAKMRDFQAEVDRKKSPPPPPLVL